SFDHGFNVEVRNGSVVDKNIPYDDMVSYLISAHEHNHFRFHCGSEYGLLFTFVAQLHHLAMIGLWQAKLRNDTFYFNYQLAVCKRLSSVLDILFRPNEKILQKEAVDTINSFYHYDLGAPFPVLKTSFPDRPCCPNKFFGYNYILEASSVILEASSLETMYPNKSFQRIQELMAADQELYGILTGNVLHAVHNFLPAATTVLELTLDTRVPIIGSPFKGEIEWEDFFPSCRLSNLAITAGEIVKSFNFDDDVYNKRPWEKYDYKVHNIIFTELVGFAKKHADFLFWDDTDVLTYKCGTDKILTKENSRSLSPVVSGSSKHIIEHLFKSFNNFKKRREKFPLFYFSTIVLDIKKGTGIEPKDFQSPHKGAFALFSVFGNRIGSVYLETNFESVISAISQKIRKDVLQHIFQGEDCISAYDRTKKNYTFGVDDLDEILFNTTSKSIKNMFMS
nr:hypothetical protein [Nitrospinota bacterium]